MYNPTYLIKSRHGIYYFRYPLPSNPHRRISISLKTRCPKLALRLAKQLEHDRTRLLSQLDLERMDHKDIMNILKNYFAEVLKGNQARIDREGAFSKGLVKNIQLNSAVLNSKILPTFCILFVL
jgi:hypothetical protein